MGCYSRHTHTTPQLVLGFFSKLLGERNNNMEDSQFIHGLLDCGPRSRKRSIELFTKTYATGQAVQVPSTHDGAYNNCVFKISTYMAPSPLIKKIPEPEKRADLESAITRFLDLLYSTTSRYHGLLHSCPASSGLDGSVCGYDMGECPRESRSGSLRSVKPR
jgi:hypothetical protein